MALGEKWKHIGEKRKCVGDMWKQVGGNRQWVDEKWRKAVKVALPLCMVIVWGICLVCMYADRVEKDIADSVVRLHILANSNSDEDQQLKLEVRDYLLEYMREKMANSASTYGETGMTSGEMDELTFPEKLSELPSVEVLSELAEEFIKTKGKNYQVRAEYCKTYFPTKEYNNVIFPAGQYNALRVLIGEGAGENWWCVMYPPLCMTNAYEGGLSEESQVMLQEQMSEESYAIINSGDGISEDNVGDGTTDIGDSMADVEYGPADDSGKIEFKMKFKVVEWYGEIKESISNWWDN